MKKTIEIDGMVRDATSEAILIDPGSGDGDVWLPLDKVELETEFYLKEDIITIYLSEELAIRKGLI